MLRPIDQYFLKQDEPTKSCLQFLRAYILNKDELITEAWKYGMPFYCYKGKMLCYLWTHKKYKQPYLGIVAGKNINHPDLLIEKRAKMKILLVDPEQDIRVELLDAVFKEILAFYQ